MKLTELFAGELDTEAAASRRVLERVPEGRNDWKPHEKSMSLGYLATLVATMPSWITMMVRQNELDFAPPGREPYRPPVLESIRALVDTHDRHVADARAAHPGLGPASPSRGGALLGRAASFAGDRARCDARAPCGIPRPSKPILPTVLTARPQRGAPRSRTFLSLPLSGDSCS